MDGKLWSQVYQTVMAIEHTGLSSRQTYSDQVIVLVYFLAVANDRPVSWACRPESWAGLQRPQKLPSQPTMSVRLRSSAVQSLLNATEEVLRVQGPHDERIRAVDGRPLTINPFSKDRDARWGYALKGLGFGYKLHAVWGNGPVPCAWELFPLNASEARVAEQLVPRLPRAVGKRYLLGDASYDTNRLHAAAAQHGYQLLAPPRHKGKGLGHRPHHPARITGLQQLKTNYGQRLYKQRTKIERSFGQWAIRSIGLDTLPAHLRRLRRVKQFVQAKIILNGFHILLRRNQFSSAA
jgi:hypothetical protein